jgi:hypothetical protein
MPHNKKKITALSGESAGEKKREKVEEGIEHKVRLRCTIFSPQNYGHGVRYDYGDCNDLIVRFDGLEE